MSENIKSDVSVFGSTGFIGNIFCELYSNEANIIPREQREPETNNILYFISTIHNYNIFDSPHLDIETNLSLLIDVLEECKNKENVIFNFISSWFVYGKTEDQPANENSTCNPKGFYSITKRTAEQLLISYCETFGINYRILRLCNVYGETDTKVSKKRNALQNLIGELIYDKDIYLYDGGENIRDFMHVEDVCRAIKLCIDAAPLNEITNIGSGNPYKFKDIILYAKNAIGSNSTLHSCEAPEFHKTVQVKDMYLDVTKLKNMGFVQKYTIWEGLDILINNLKEVLNE
jgi:nucleoside-diphosphate-sugar epimerase